MPLFMLALAVVIAAFCYGGLVGRYELFPFSVISNGVKTARNLLDTWDIEDRGRFSAVSPDEAAPNRIRFVEGSALRDPILWYGGRFQFMDYCPDSGCIAVEYETNGEVARVWPLQFDDLEEAFHAFSDDDNEFPIELSPNFSFARDVRPIGISQFANGDLLVTFVSETDVAFPYSVGVARVDGNGHPLWARRDLSHHWPSMTDGDIALVPGFDIGAEPISVEIAPDAGGGGFELTCPDGKFVLDTVNFIDGDGRLLKRFHIMDALLESPFAPVLRGANPCDPIHLNHVVRLEENAGDAWGADAGDLVVSLRNLSAFAILDGESGGVKRLVRGSFFQQHSVRHLEGSTFIMFDNHGSDGSNGPSRLLMVDLADGSETTIFPNDKTPEDLRLFSRIEGKIDISPDRSRAIVVFAQGTAVEVRLSDGEVLNIFENLHDVSGLEQFGEERREKSAIFKMLGLDYARQRTGANE